jgi:hypothetical protein
VNVTPEQIAILDAACRVSTKENAEHYVRRVSTACERDIDWARKAICYWAAFFNHKVRLRVERTYGAVHPIFGSATRGPMDPTQAFLLGMRTADKSFPWPSRPAPAEEP